MDVHSEKLIQVVDGLVADLKEESDRLGHETRISLLAFSHEVEVLVWDMDVKHLPSMKGLYGDTSGATALIEATCKGLDDLGHIWEEYGSHSFLSFTVTDGKENASGFSETGRMHTSGYGSLQYRAQLDKWTNLIQRKIGALPEHWTAAILVPDVMAKRTAVSYGFPAGNVAIWDTTSASGVEEAIGTVKAAATNFLRGRESGVRGTKTLFSAVGQDLSVDTVKSVLEPLAVGSYGLYEVKDEEHDMEIRHFVEKRTKKPYRPRSAYYELGPRVKVQANKDVLVYMKKAGDDAERVYGGDDARELLFGVDGRSNGELSVKAGHNPDLKVLVMSGSVNRKLKKGTKLLVKF
jgi:hypothetical protein